MPQLLKNHLEINQLKFFLFSYLLIVIIKIWGGVDQSNQLRAAFTTHFARNRKEFFPKLFFVINIAVVNSYKLNLVINDSKTISINKRNSTQHREFIEELVNLLFLIEDEDSSNKITQKPYLKYKYQLDLKEKKSIEKNTLFQNIHQFSQHSQIQNSAQKRGYYIFYSKKDISRKN